MPGPNLNINRSMEDEFYRYKMAPLEAKIEGKGNGIKTVVTNLSSVGNSLAREPSHLIKYFGFELGAQTNNSPADDRWIINGAHEASKLQDYLDGFIKRFVLCKKCKNPETKFVFATAGKILLECNACGEFSDADQRHKLSAYILKTSSKKGKKDKSTKKAERKARKERGAQDGEEGSGDSPHDSNDDDDGNVDGANGDTGLYEDERDEEAKRAQEIVVEKDVEFSLSTSKAAVAARANKLSDDVKNKVVLDEPIADKTAENADKFGEWIDAEAKAKGDMDKVSNVEIYLKAMELGVQKSTRAVWTLAGHLFDETIAEQLEDRASLLNKMIKNEKGMRAFLEGLERYVMVNHSEWVKNVMFNGKFLMAIYNEDIASKEAFQQFLKRRREKVKPAKGDNELTAEAMIAFRRSPAAKKFLKYLETVKEDSEDDEAEEEGSGDDDDDEEEE